MYLYEKDVSIPAVSGHRRLLSYFSKSLRTHLRSGEWLTRFVVTKSDAEVYRCDMGVLGGNGSRVSAELDPILRFTHRGIQSNVDFNVVLVVPTGVGCEIGGHAGDAGPVARLLSGTCDTLITHPNVVNASDIAEISQNTLYVEGSVISRLLMGTIGLQPVRANRVLVVIDEHRDEYFTNQTINAVSAARSCYGLQCPRVVRLNPPIAMRAEYTSSSRAAGRIEGLERLQEVLDAYRNEYDAVAIASVVEVPHNYHMDYFLSNGKMINPWGGVEAMLTHWVSLAYNVPSAHAPMLESKEIADLNPGLVDTRIAAEAISITFMQCILKGLQRSPRIVTERDLMKRHNVLTAADLSCLVIPDGCVGLPTLAALEQGIPVIAVRENRNIMQNHLSELPWAHGQFYQVENYWEACGVLTALKEGLAPECVRRPLPTTVHERKNVLIAGTSSSGGSAVDAPKEKEENLLAQAALGRVGSTSKQ